MKKLLLKSIGFGLNTLAIVAPKRAGKAGFQLFCYPFRAPITKKQRHFLESANRFLLPLKKEELQVYQWGNGPEKIVLLHGWQSHSYRWKSYINALDKNRYTIYALDAPAHGLSTGRFLTVPLYAEAVTALLDKIGKVEVVLAHSLGSFTAIYTFFTHPELAPEKLILTAPPADAREFFDFYRSQLGLSPKTMQLVGKKFTEVIRQTPDYFSATNFVQSLRIPGLIIHDEEDQETSVENAKAIHKAWRNSELMLTKGHGHNLKSMEVVKRVVSFIEEPANAFAERA